jgi:CO dehydrogenase/acetyl-CoA synthase beta subunit
MVTCIRSLYYKTPTDELGELILSLNQLLAESETSYNQRMAHTKKKEEEEEEEKETEPSQPSSGGENLDTPEEDGNTDNSGNTENSDTSAPSGE